MKDFWRVYLSVCHQAIDEFVGRISYKEYELVLPEVDEELVAGKNGNNYCKSRFALL